MAFNAGDMDLGDVSLARFGIPQYNPEQFGKNAQFDPNNLPMNGWQKFGMGANALTGLAGAYSAYKQLGLMEDQLNMQRKLANRNVANSAVTTNKNLSNQATMAAQMQTGTQIGDEAYELARERLYTPVDGSPVV